MKLEHFSRSTNAHVHEAESVWVLRLRWFHSPGIKGERKRVGGGFVCSGLFSNT